MENFLGFEATVDEDFRGLTKGTTYDFNECIFLLDDNGKGKSTLLKGILASNSGDKNINNPTPKGIINLPIAGICKIGYFGQDSNMKTLGYMVDEDFGLSLSALKSSSGEGVFNQVINTIKNNDIIILDEPSTSLSIKNIRKLVAIIQKVSEMDTKSFIISDHNETFLKFFKEEKAYRVDGTQYLVKDYLKEQYMAEL